MLANYEVEMLTEDCGRGVALVVVLLVVVGLLRLQQHQRQSGEVENEMVEKAKWKKGS